MGKEIESCLFPIVHHRNVRSGKVLEGAGTAVEKPSSLG